MTRKERYFKEAIRNAMESFGVQVALDSDEFIYYFMGPDVRLRIDVTINDAEPLEV